jgi:hypothetical protein
MVNTHETPPTKLRKKNENPTKRKIIFKEKKNTITMQE